MLKAATWHVARWLEKDFDGYAPQPLLSGFVQRN